MSRGPARFRSVREAFSSSSSSIFFLNRENRLRERGRLRRLGRGAGRTEQGKEISIPNPQTRHGTCGFFFVQDVSADFSSVRRGVRDLKTVKLSQNVLS